MESSSLLRAPRVCCGPVRTAGSAGIRRQHRPEHRLLLPLSIQLTRAFGPARCPVPAHPLRSCLLAMANVKSLSDLNGEGSDDEEGKYNDYYAGGEKSGQLVRGAPQDDEDDDEEGDDRVGDLFKKAKAIGARQGTADDLPLSEAFQGTGRSLSGRGPPAAGQRSNHVVRFYRNGVFTVNDGPPRAVEDPANMDFMDAVSSGECPRELDPGPGGEPVTVNLLRIEEDYEMPKYVAFQGAGNTLGSSSSHAAAGASSSGAAAPAPAAAPGEWRGVDEAQPTTSLQLRLFDGSRMVARFNHAHTVADIRAFIRASRPDMTGPYQLTTGFPAAPLGNEDATLEAAGLLNAVVIQKR